MNKNIFRAYDIRGNSKTDLDQTTITKIGYVLGKRIKKNDHDYLFNLTRKGFDGKSSKRTVVFNKTKLTYQDRQSKLNESGEIEATKAFKSGSCYKVR